MTNEDPPAASEGQTDSNDIRTGDELSARQTGMSFQRTRMSAERTLMAVIRTSVSLIAFGFTIHQGFQTLFNAGIIESRGAGAYFGASLVFIGIGMLLVGIYYHIVFMVGLRRLRNLLKAEGLIHAESVYPVSLTLIVALLLLGLAFVAVGAMLSGT